MTSYKKSLLFFLLIVLVLQISLAIGFQINTRQGWNDEAKFHKTFVQFSEKIDIETLKHYEQMSPPLPFIIFGLWGRIFGSSLFSLRLLNIILAIVTYLLFHRVTWELTANKKVQFLSCLYFIFFPYMIGLSIFAYTETTTLLFLLLSILFLIRKNRILYAIFLSCAVLTRQYLLFFSLGAGIYFLLKWLVNKNKNDLKFVIYTIAGTLPYLMLVIFWGGLSPDNQWRNYFLDTGISYKANFLVHYIILLFLFLLPYHLIRFKELYSDTKIIVTSVILSLAYFIAPVTYEHSHILGVNTVGLFDRTLQYLFSSETIIQTIYYLLFLLALPVLIYILKETYSKIKNNSYDILLFLDLIIISFLIVMPFSYIGWEKYFIPLLPLMIISLSDRVSTKKAEPKTTPL